MPRSTPAMAGGTSSPKEESKGLMVLGNDPYAVLQASMCVPLTQSDRSMPGPNLHLHVALTCAASTSFR